MRIAESRKKVKLGYYRKISQFAAGRVALRAGAIEKREIAAEKTGRGNIVWHARKGPSDGLTVVLIVRPAEPDGYAVSPVKSACDASCW